MVRELALRALHEKDFIGSEKLLTDAIADVSFLFWCRGKARIGQENFIGAVDDCKLALQLNPSVCHPFYYMGKAYLKLKNLEAAKGALTQGFALADIKMKKKFKLMWEKCSDADFPDGANAANLIAQVAAPVASGWNCLFDKQLKTGDLKGRLSFVKKVGERIAGEAISEEVFVGETVNVRLQRDDDDVRAVMVELKCREIDTTYTLWWKNFLKDNPHWLETNQWVTFYSKWEQQEGVPTLRMKVVKGQIPV
ncbi:hypothetical protein RHSIM_Rhsim03G0071400 [Rhododendron simsii]|uniref:Uncharacterized protein n=1 Tax=Rhododendron simsii TaxID=118357 RepID=A0A834HCF8_RHOSS|nr:hypothetical protein RHSIM_Rhsim03G0071400 [Rhododendron simsii]